jgi:hypothetical protein
MIPMSRKHLNPSKTKEVWNISREKARRSEETKIEEMESKKGW